MAGRKDKNVVDYFPHQCEHGKTLFILENKYPFKGYCVWFKTLELLGKTENHFIDCRKAEDWEYLSAYMKLSSEELKDIYNICARLDAIHSELWQNKIIWSGNFIKGILDVYRKREHKCTGFNDLCRIISVKMRSKYDDFGISGGDNSISGINITQSKVKESKVKESRISEEEIFDEEKPEDIPVTVYNEERWLNQKKVPMDEKTRKWLGLTEEEAK